MTALDPVGLLPPVALADLPELLTRVDRKYVLPLTDLPLVLSGLEESVRVLEIDGARSFRYRSRYFDTPTLTGYLGAARQRRRRFKLRVRTYADTGEHFLEVKTRGPRGVTVKHRMPYDGDPRRAPQGQAREWVDAVLTAAGIDDVPGVPLAPTLTTAYRRTTLHLPDSDSRVTVDTDLTWSLPDGTGALRTPDRTIVETKAGRAGCAADRLLWSLRHRPCPISKYGTGLAALRPELPAHRWLPVLRRHFPTALDGSPA